MPKIRYSLNQADIIIIGGGLAGLTAAIHLARKNLEVILFEKEEFPHHKVCGEYVSKEILPYMEELEIPLRTLKPAEITRLLYSTSKGNSLEVDLPLGGLGLSRYCFDNFLFEKACGLGVKVVQETVVSVSSGEPLVVETQHSGLFSAMAVLGCFGKRSSLDKTLNRPFFKQPASWLAVKAHYSGSFPDDLVALHNFKGGYCGLSKTESGSINVCYLATYRSFKKWKDPEAFKENVLRKNPLLDTFFANAEQEFERPLTIAQVSFQPKSAVHEHVLMAGDAAGLLHPLCGNGMAMAIHSAKIASEAVFKFFSESFNRAEMEKEYQMRWEKEFKSRIRTGKYLQRILLNDHLAEISQSVVSRVPFILPQIIRRTHGKPIQ